VVRVQGTPAAATVFVDDAAAVQVSARRDGDVLEIRHAGGFHRYRQACGPDRTVWLARDGFSFPFGEQEFVLASRGEAAGAGPVTSPMPGTVLVVKVAAGDVVKAGTPLLVVEAMKMEHTVTAPIDGVVSELPVRAGQQVALDETLAIVTNPAKSSVQP
jgi:acetyl-CoA/propionyl-CoA carboxylase biotin carboxyl carrier protein